MGVFVSVLCVRIEARPQCSLTSFEFVYNHHGNLFQKFDIQRTELEWHQIWHASQNQTADFHD